MAADETVSIDIFIQADKSQQTLGDLKKGFAALEEELEGTNRSTVEGKKRFDQLSTAMAKTGSEIKNVELGFESLDSEGVASQIGGLAGGIGDLSASMVLLGDDSESMKEMAANIELAMGISMGMKGAIEGMSAASKLYRTQLKGLTLLQAKNNIATKVGAIATKIWAAATTVAGVAMKAFNAILKLNPIGLIVTALGLAVLAFAAFKGVLGDVVDFLMKPFQAAWNAAVDVLQFFGIVESDAAKSSRKASETRAAAARKAADSIVKDTDRLIEKSKEATTIIIGEIDKEIQRRQAAGEEFRDLTEDRIKNITAALAEEIRLNQKAFNDLAAMQSKAKANNDYLAWINAASKKDQINMQLKDQIEAQDEATFELELFEIETAKIKKESRRERTAIEKADAADNQIERIERVKMEALEVAEVEAEIAQVKVLTMQEYLDEQTALEEKKHQDMLNRLAEEDAARQANIDKFQAGLNVLNAASDLFVNNEKKRDKIKKALALAQIAIDTARAISSGIAAAAAAGPFPANIAAILSTVAVVLANMASAKKLLSSAGAGSVSLPSGGEAAGGGANISPVSNTSTLTGSMPTSVVSVEEINTVSNKVDAIEQAATIG